jgi:hypothetical protein
MGVQAYRPANGQIRIANLLRESVEAVQQTAAVILGALPRASGRTPSTAAQFFTRVSEFGHHLPSSNHVVARWRARTTRITLIFTLG